MGGHRVVLLSRREPKSKDSGQQCRPGLVTSQQVKSASALRLQCVPLQSTPCPTRQGVSEVATRPTSLRQTTGSGKCW